MNPYKFLLGMEKTAVLHEDLRQYKMILLRWIQVKLKNLRPTKKTFMALNPILGSFIFLVPKKTNLHNVLENFLLEIQA